MILNRCNAIHYHLHHPNAIGYRGMNFTSLLVTLTLFSGIFLTINQWTSYQRQSAVQIYQVSQAIQIGENQQQRRLANLPCQTQVQQNGQVFKIQCQASVVRISYAGGEIKLTID